MTFTLSIPIYKRTNSWICLGIFFANLSRTFHDPSLTGSVVSGQYIEAAVGSSHSLFFDARMCFVVCFPVTLPFSTAIVGFLVWVVWRVVVRIIGVFETPRTLSSVSNYPLFGCCSVISFIHSFITLKSLTLPAFFPYSQN